MTEPRSYARRPHFPRRPGGVRARLLAVGLAFALGPAAQALGQARADKGGEGWRLSVLLGLFVGHDSNVGREDPENRDSDSVTELLGRLAFTSRKGNSGLDLRYQFRSDSYGQRSDQDYAESQTLLAFRTAAKKTRFAVRAEYALLVEPEDIEIAENLKRTRIGFLPEVDLRLGRLELGVGYSLRSLRYEDTVFRDLGGEPGDLDRDDSAFRAELRWRGEKAESQQVFAHLELGRTDYDRDVPRTDFDHLRLYVGWRSESTGRSGIEIGTGTDTLDSSRISSETTTFALVRYRSSLRGEGERPAMEVAYARGAQAAATADYKSTATFLVRYIQATKSRFSWSIGILSEKAEFANPDPGAAEALFRLSVDAALRLEFGRSGGARGRWYASVGYEMRRGDSPEDKYYRMLLMTGAAFVY